MATGQGTEVINFGAFPGSNETSVVVSAPGITAGSKAEAFMMGDDTSADHTASDHRYAAALMGLTCGTPGTGSFTIYARSIEKLQGQFSVRFVWAD